MVVESTAPNNSSNQTVILGVAALHIGGEALVEALGEADFDVAYLYDSDLGTEYVTLEDMPPFDLLVASLPAAVGKHVQAMGITLRFLRERRSAPFILTGEIGEDCRKLTLLDAEANVLGYQTDLALETKRGSQTYLVGTQPESGFRWTRGIMARTGLIDRTAAVGDESVTISVVRALTQAS